jgi:hypothetical protein
MITALTIIETMKKWVEEKHPISPATWLDAGLKMNVLRGDLDDRLFELESELAKQKADLLGRDEMTVAKAESIIKAEDKYREMRKAQAQIKQVEEFIRLAKKFSSLKEEEYIHSR